MTAAALLRLFKLLSLAQQVEGSYNVNAKLKVVLIDLFRRYIMTVVDINRKENR